MSEEEEGDFDDARLAAEAAENGIPDIENMPDADILDRPGDLAVERQLIDATFSKALNAVEEPEIETVEEAIDMDEDPVERQIIRYEFDEEVDTDNIAIYTLPSQTVQNVSSVITSTNFEGTYIELFENGRMIITYEGDDWLGEEDDTTIYAPHNFTAANGYTFRDGQIIKPDGTELLS